MVLWVIRAGQDGQYEDIFERDKIIAIGFVSTDLSNTANRDKLETIYHKEHPGASDATARNEITQVWGFLRELKKDDLIVLPLKTRKEILLGQIVSDYRHSRNIEKMHHTRQVEWLQAFPDSTFDDDTHRSLNAPMTVYQVKADVEEKLRKVVAEKNEELTKARIPTVLVKFNTWLTSVEGQSHLARIENEKNEIKQIMKKLGSIDKASEEFTSQVIDYLLPYYDTKYAKRISMFPSMWNPRKIARYKDYTSEDWNKLTNFLYNFVNNVTTHPENITEYTEEFASNPLHKGFQSGVMSPILFCLNDSLALINKRVRETYKDFAKVLGWNDAIEQRIRTYEQDMQRSKSLMRALADPLITNPTIFDIFCYWYDEKFKKSIKQLPAPRHSTYFILRSGADSRWQDEEGIIYHYGSNVANFLKLSPGAKVIFDRNNSGTIEYTGCADIRSTEDLEYESADDIDRSYSEKIAKLTNYSKFAPPRQRTPEVARLLETLTGYNTQHSIRPINDVIYNLIVKNNSRYAISDLSAEVHLSEDTLKEWEVLLEDKKQIIFYGPPGTGKTYIAKKFAQYFSESGRTGKYKIVQFHPSYSYEDFVEGIRPSLTGDGQLDYRIQAGIFKNYCKEAIDAPSDSKYVLIIDEINRGNLSRIFGELIYGLEYRGEKDGIVNLQYSGDFYIPSNLYIIGTMNSADRSIALVDYALRRRFYFVELMPSIEILEEYLSYHAPSFGKSKILEIFQKINDRIVNEEKLGRHYQIGHSVFMREHLDEKAVARIWKYVVRPIIEEYYIDSPEGVDEFGKIFDIFGSA